MNMRCKKGGWMGELTRGGGDKKGVMGGADATLLQLWGLSL